MINEEWLIQAATREKANLELGKANRDSLFETLASAGITKVTVYFDGSGDEGQIESTVYLAEDLEIEPPDANVERRQYMSALEPAQLDLIPLDNAIEALVYDLLMDRHLGWQDGEGSYGVFTFDVTQRTITLDINVRFVESDNFQYEL